VRSRRRSLGALWAATFGCAALAAFGVVALSSDADAAEARYRAQAAAALRAGLDALDASLRSPSDVASDGLPIVVAADGALLDPAPSDFAAAAPTPTAEDEATASLVDLLELETARLERTSGAAAAAARLREIVERGDAAEGTDVRPWALTALAAVEKAAGRLDSARAAWRRVADEFPNARDRRGNLRAHVARLLLLESDPTATTADCISLYDDVAADAGPKSASAGAWLRGRAAEVAQRTASRDPALDAAARARLAEVAAREARRARVHAFVDAWANGGGAWARGGAEGGARSFAAESGATFLVLLDAPRPEDGSRRGVAIEPDVLSARALQAPPVRSFASIGLRAAVAIGPRGKDDLADAPLPPPWPEATRAFVVGDDLAGFRAAERRKFALGVGAALLAFVVATAAAFATARATEREVRAARDRESFVAATTHELKTPLAAIKVLAELLLDPNLDVARRAEFAARVGSEADRLARLVAAVLDFARMERTSAAELRARFAPLDVVEATRAVVETFRPIARAEGRDVAFVAPTTAVVVRGDADLLAGALLDVLDNAVKYGGAGPIDVAIVADAAARRVAIRTADRGPGVAAADRARIFEPFVRLGDELTRERKGVGLGLALVARAAAAHGGRAYVEPREGGGSVFVLELPSDGGAESPEG
jgi:signal transduction histidine kinase